MRITSLIKKSAIELHVTLSSKTEAIDKLVALHDNAGNLLNAEAYKQGILAREAGSTTAVGMGIAIPHCKSDAVKSPALAAITVPNGVDYESPDGQPANLIFMIAAPSDGRDVHLEVLSRLMTMLMDEEFTSALKAAKTKAEFLSIIDSKEKEKYPEESVADVETSGYRILAVTACPTGIAHTFMAAEALEKAGKKLGYPLKAETNGSGGAKNVLTAEEIANCEGIIIAADRSVEMARFDGKPVISTKVADGIHKPEDLINKIINGEARIYHHTGAKEESSSSDGEGLGRQLYKHLMNGVSHMLPFVVAGGIFIALAFLIDSVLGAPQDSGFGTNTALAAWFKKIGDAAFGFMIPIMAGYIAMSIADRPGLLVGFVGGYLATTGATFASPGGDVPSGFLGALLAGFVGGYLMLYLEKLCDNIPNSLEGIKPVLIYPLAGLAMIAIIMCTVNPFMGMINTGLANFLSSIGTGSKVLLGCVLGGMMAIDMGGPFNKAAYVFGTAAIASGNYDIMAAVMIGGMVPPIAIALSTTFFKNRWTADERKNGIVNYIMGLSFITEGAIPYAAADPLRVIPSCIVGSAIAGGISMAANCTLMAPHGGIFVFAVVGNWTMYLLALAIGSAAGMGMLAVLKKNVSE